MGEVIDLFKNRRDREEELSDSEDRLLDNLKRINRLLTTLTHTRELERTNEDD